MASSRTPLPPAKGFDNTVGAFGYLCLCLNVLFFSSLLAADPGTFHAWPLSREDYWVESLTAVWFLLAGLLLFVTGLAERSFLRRCVYVLGGMAMGWGGAGRARKSAGGSASSGLRRPIS